MKYPNQNGFTLIELLVVISIIGILSTVVLTGLSEVRESAQDTTIKKHMRALATTMESYRTYNNGSYEIPGITDEHGTDLYVDGSGNTCSMVDFGTGPQSTKLRDLCQAIADSITYESTYPNINFMWWGIDHSAANISNESDFSFLVELNSGERYCIGSSGNTSLLPVTGPDEINWWAPGCWGNP